MLLELPYSERRKRLLKVVGKPIEVTPATDDRDAAGTWLTGASEGVVAKDAGCSYKPGERVGMVKVKRVRTADAVVAAFRFGKQPDTVGSLILGMYGDDDGELHVIGHTSSFRAKQKRELLELLGDEDLARVRDALAALADAAVRLAEAGAAAAPRPTATPRPVTNPRKDPA